jgi:FADH2 O2-dependent halogenase
MTSTAPDRRTRYDVVILGTGLVGSLLGAVLARNGVSVLLVDEAAHPRFASGESTAPYPLATLRAIAARYRVPEIKTLTTFTNCTRIIAPSFGVARHNGFLLHHEGRPHDPRESDQVTMPGPSREASHLYRQDSDAYLFHTALRYGCDARQNARVDGLDIDGSGVTVEVGGGERFHARYLVDATDARSPLARALALRDDPCRLKHQSRSLSNHLTGVTPTDRILPARGRAGAPPAPWHQGTVHHVFPHGWFWVIAFDNHPSSHSALCSVGLALDPRVHAATAGLPPADEFAEISARFPDIARQFAGAAPVRNWSSTDRLQYSSRRTVGDRWCLLGDAAGFVDPLFSSSLAMSVEAVDALAWRLLRAVGDDDFSADRFAYVDELQQALLDDYDELVGAAYVSFADNELWTAVRRIWAVGNDAGCSRQRAALTRFARDGRDDHFRALEETPAPGFPWPDHGARRKLFTAMAAACAAYESASLSAERAAAELREGLRETATPR